MDFNKTQSVSKRLREAMETNDANQIEEAFDDIATAAAEDAYAQLKQDMELYEQTHDQAILERRGARDLTTKETAWYNRIADVMRSSNPKQVFTEIIGSDDEDDIMPNTIIEDVFRNLTQDHPLLSKVNLQNVGYLTKWIRNRHSVQSAAWGTITAAIEKEITSAWDVVDVKQNKLSCFVVLERGMADMGPVWLDTYIRTVMKEAMAVALETAIVSGTGISMPIGMDRITTTGSTTEGYTQKTAVAVTSFQPAEYGTLLANFAKDEDGHRRKFNSVAIICNQNDYLTKIMPATTVLNGNGVYVNNLFPFPTEVIVSDVVEDGKAIIGLLKEYYLYVGKAARNNVIEYTDDYKFLEDQRVFKVVQYADGRAFDNTSFQLLDISGLNPAYITVENVATA
ncbi:MAG: phage major capsid protein [Lachnospiraceae bacterium]|nr:phage major capsid protein [Lachnospiraceae bacterium]